MRYDIDTETPVTRIKVAIAVAEEARDRIYEVAAVCRALGFGHTSTLSDVGVLMGSVEPADLPTLRAIPGVAAIETERNFALDGTPAREH